MVREDKVVDLVVERDAADFLAVREDGDGRIYFEVVSDPILSTAGLLDQTGLELSMARGAFVPSKRLSRLFSPYRMWSFYQTDEVTISECAALDGKLWDGIGLVTRDLSPVPLPHMALNVPDRFRPKIQHVGDLPPLRGHGADRRGPVIRGRHRRRPPAGLGGPDG